MGLVIWLLFLVGCAGFKEFTPADRVKGEKFYYDCCDPSLSEPTQEMCDLARDYKRNTLVDQDGNKYIFRWSDCKPGEEKWRL